jgi:hypothetical protein
MRARHLLPWLPTVLILWVVALVADAAPICQSTEYTYRFVNRCAEPVWIGQRSTTDTASHPPRFGGWTLSSMCTANADCPSRACDRNSGQCTCKSAAECPGDAACLADGKCATGAIFCMPQSWSSGTFWPRTGCRLDGSARPAELACQTGACFGTHHRPLLDCSVANGGGSPTNPVTQFEVTSVAPTSTSDGSVNYDVSLAAGYNVETKAVPIGGGQVVPGTPGTDVVACYDAGCGQDLNASCPSALQVKDGGAVVGCLDPCTRCQRADAPAALRCHDELPDTWTCGAKSGKVTYPDLYCAKNTVDGTAQASANQGTPTAFGQRDCPPHTTFVRPTFTSDYRLPLGQGVCLYTNPPQATTPHFNDFSWADAPSGTTKGCGGLPPHYDALPNGTACGGYLTKQKGGGWYPDAIGYTCQEARFPVHGGGTETAHLCMPPTTSGLGTCTEDTKYELPLFTATAGVTNPAWLEAGKAAGGGTVPYYQTFKNACIAAYAWQYDDIASGFGCTPKSKTAHGTEFQGFDVVFCGSRAGETSAHGRADRVVGLDASGRAGGIEQPGKGRLRIRGRTTLPADVALSEAAVVLTDLLDEVGAAGELVDGGAWTLPPASSGNARKAVFESAAGAAPRLKVVLRRPRAGDEHVKVVVAVRKATIGRPAACDDADQAKLETGLSISAAGGQTRVGSIASWRCGKKALRGG